MTNLTKNWFGGAGHGIEMSTGDTYVPKRKGGEGKKGRALGYRQRKELRISAGCADGRHSACFSLACTCGCGHGSITKGKRP